MTDRVETGRPDPAAPGAGPPEPEDRSLGDLIRELASESGRLVREEVELAKTELREKLEVYEQKLGEMSVGIALLLGAFGLLLLALERALTLLLVPLVGAGVAVWLAPVVLALVIGTVGWRVVDAARDRVGEEGIMPEEAIRTAREEKEWLEREAKEVRRG